MLNSTAVLLGDSLTACSPICCPIPVGFAWGSGEFVDLNNLLQEYRPFGLLRGRKFVTENREGGEVYQKIDCSRSG